MSGLGLRWADLCAQGQMRQEEPPPLALPLPTLAVRSTLPALGQPHDVKSPRLFCLALPPLRVCVAMKQSLSFPAPSDPLSYPSLWNIHSLDKDCRKYTAPWGTLLPGTALD